MLEHYLSLLTSGQPEVVQEAVMQCGLILEAASLTDADIDNLLSELTKLFPMTTVEAQSGIIWAIGKSSRQQDIEKLRTLFPIAWNLKDYGVLWQWLIAYENLAGSTILQPDHSIFEKFALIVGSDRRLGNALPRFVS